MHALETHNSSTSFHVTLSLLQKQSSSQKGKEQGKKEIIKDNMAGSDLAKEEKLPPGFRFHPSDEELITYYLINKISDANFTGRAIGDVDLNKCEPWELPGSSKAETLLSNVSSTHDDHVVSQFYTCAEKKKLCALYLTRFLTNTSSRPENMRTSHAISGILINIRSSI